MNIVESLRTKHRGTDDYDKMVASVAADTIERWARWIVRRGENLLDHACNDCVPNGEIVKAGFKCVFHEAVQVVGSSNGRNEAPAATLAAGRLD